MIQSSFDEIRTIDRDVFDCKYCAIVVGWKSAASATADAASADAAADASSSAAADASSLPVSSAILAFCCSDDGCYANNVGD